jgi:hypothetical protein
MQRHPSAGTRDTIATQQGFAAKFLNQQLKDHNGWDNSTLSIPDDLASVLEPTYPAK